MGAEFARRTNRKHEQENEPLNSRQGKEREVLLHKILGVAHFVAQKAAKVAQNTPFLGSTAYRKLLICIRWEYYLANFKTAGFNRSPTPPFLILTYSEG